MSTTAAEVCSASVVSACSAGSIMISISNEARRRPFTIVSVLALALCRNSLASSATRWSSWISAVPSFTVRSAL
jgi:hypothetical protein